MLFLTPQSYVANENVRYDNPDQTVLAQGRMSRSPNAHVDIWGRLVVLLDK